MDGVFSPEKNDTKISHFGQAVLILEHVIPGHVRFKMFTPQLKLCLKTRQKTLTMVIVIVRCGMFKKTAPVGFLC